jgi:hypothetical protein
MAHDDGAKAGIAVDDDARAKKMLALVVEVAGQHGFELGDIVHGKGVITVPVGKGEVRIVSVLKSPPLN